MSIVAIASDGLMCQVFFDMVYVGVSDFQQVNKLFEGNEYMFRVVAVNKIGESEPAMTSAPVKTKLPFG